MAEERYFPQGTKEINAEWEGIDTLQLGKILKQHANFASLGAIGPDLFFFLPDFKDYEVLGAKVSTSSVLVKVLEFLEEIYKALENHMDTFWYLQDPLSSKSGDLYSQLTESALYFDIAFGGKGQIVSRPGYSTGQTLREKWQRRRKLDLDSQLPQPVADALISAMKQVFYQDGKHPKILQDNEGRPSTQLIQDAYDLFFRYLKLVTVDGFSHEPPDPPQIFGNLDFPTPSDPHEDPPGEGDTGGSGSIWDDILNFILSIINAIGYILEVALWLATLPWALIADLVTFPIRLALYYALEMPLFHLLKMFRNVLVMSGYLLPQKDEISSGLIHINWPDQDTFRQILHTIDDPFGGTQDVPPGAGEDKYRDKMYPRLHPDKEYLHPWKYPMDAHVELPTTIAGPFASGADPTVLFGDRGQDASIRDRLQDAQTPQEADTVDCDLTPDRHLGDSVSFSKYLIWLESRFKQQKDGKPVPLIEWNLDADRGYGYHCWDWNRDAHGQPQKDPEGNKFQPPCTWPPQAGKDSSGKDLFMEEKPLKIYWVGKDTEGQELRDVGCVAPDPQNPEVNGLSGKYISRGCHAIVRCPETWVPIFENQGHECLVVRAYEPVFDPVGRNQFAAADDRHIGQRNIAVVHAASPAAIDLGLRLGYNAAPADTEIAVETSDPASVEWLKLLLGKQNPGLQPATSPIVSGFLPPVVVGSPLLPIKDIDFDCRGQLLKPSERFHWGCDPLEVPFHASIQEIDTDQVYVLRIRQKVEGEVVGGYSVVLLGKKT